MSEKTRELNKDREMLYRLLSSIYLYEIDKDMLSALQGMEFPVSEEGSGWQQDLIAGFALVKSYLAGYEGKDEAETGALLEDLAADYAKTFLAAGDAAGKAAFPYESIYTGADRHIGGSVQMQLQAAYTAKGFEMKKDMFTVMEDHIGLEFCFLAELLKQQAEAKDEKEAEAIEEEIRTFFAEHPAKWAGLFANDVYKYSERDFYKGFARITLGFVEAEKALFAE